MARTHGTTSTRAGVPRILCGLVIVVTALALVGAPQPQAAWAAPQSRVEQQLRDFETNTGLVLTEIPETEGTYLAKTHRGYQVLFTTQMGDVWGRYFARIAMGEIGREVGRVLAFLTRSYGYGSGPAGSILDRLLARAIGQPLGIMVYLSHAKPGAPRLDVVSGSSTVKPEEELPKWERIGFGPGTLYSPNAQFARAVLDDKELTDRLKKLRGQYIAVDGELVAFIWSGQETDFSAMIREHDDYYDMINSIIESLADIADHIPESR